MPKKLSDKIKQERINFLRKLAKTKKYTRADLIKLFQEKYGVLIRENFLREAIGGMKLPSGKGLATAAKQSEAKSKYLKNYTYEDLERDIRSGKTRTEIVDDILKKNPSDVKDIRRLTLSALKSRIIKRPELEKIEQQFLKQNIKNSKSALNDIKNFIDKNKEAYKKVYASNKIGAVDNFKEKVLDYASQKYPNFVKRSKGGRDILTGQRVFLPYGMFRELQQRGDVGREIGIKRDIRKALDIPERAPIGEATTQRLNRNYNSALTKLLKEAQDTGDANAVADATEKLSRASAEAENLRRLAAQQQIREKRQAQQVPEEAYQPTLQPQTAEIDPKAEAWSKKNSWFGDDQAMTFAAFGIHKELVEGGVDPASDIYYDEVDRLMRENFPHKFSEEQAAPVQQVAASSRGASGKNAARKVKLTPSQVAIAKRLNVPLEEYAKHIEGV